MILKIKHQNFKINKKSYNFRFVQIINNSVDYIYKLVHSILKFIKYTCKSSKSTNNLIYYLFIVSIVYCTSIEQDNEINFLNDHDNKNYNLSKQNTTKKILYEHIKKKQKLSDNTQKINSKNDMCTTNNSLNELNTNHNKLKLNDDNNFLLSYISKKNFKEKKPALNFNLQIFFNKIHPFYKIEERSSNFEMKVMYNIKSLYDNWNKFFLIDERKKEDFLNMYKSLPDYLKLSNRKLIYMLNNKHIKSKNETYLKKQKNDFKEHESYNKSNNLISEIYKLNDELNNSHSKNCNTSIKLDKFLNGNNISNSDLEYSNKETNKFNNINFIDFLNVNDRNDDLRNRNINQKEKSHTLTSEIDKANDKNIDMNVALNTNATIITSKNNTPYNNYVKSDNCVLPDTSKMFLNDTNTTYTSSNINSSNNISFNTQYNSTYDLIKLKINESKVQSEFYEIIKLFMNDLKKTLNVVKLINKNKKIDFYLKCLQNDNINLSEYYIHNIKLTTEILNCESIKNCMNINEFAEKEIDTYCKSQIKHYYSITNYNLQKTRNNIIAENMRRRFEFYDPQDLFFYVYNKFIYHENNLIKILSLFNIGNLWDERQFQKMKTYLQFKIFKLFNLYTLDYENYQLIKIRKNENTKDEYIKKNNNKHEKIDVYEFLNTDEEDFIIIDDKNYFNMEDKNCFLNDKEIFGFKDNDHIIEKKINVKKTKELYNANEINNQKDINHMNKKINIAHEEKQKRKSNVVEEKNKKTSKSKKMTKLDLIQSDDKDEFYRIYNIFRGVSKKTNHDIYLKPKILKNIPISNNFKTIKKQTLLDHFYHIYHTMKDQTVSYSMLKLYILSISVRKQDDISRLMLIETNNDILVLVYHLYYQINKIKIKILNAEDKFDL